MNLTPDSPIGDLFRSLPSALSSKLLKKERTFKRLGFTSPGAILGTLTPEMPPDFNVKSRGLTSQAQRVFKGTLNRERRVKQLARTLKIAPDELEVITATATKLTGPLERSKPTKSEWFFGSSGQKSIRSRRDFHVLKADELDLRTPDHSGRWELPDLNARLGAPWDQGYRPTCVAFACSALVQYLAPWSERPSPQFYYHQCKMQDGDPNGSGTFISTAMQIVSDRRLSGREYDWGTADAGLVPENAWPYEGDVIRGNQAHTPPPKSRRDRLYNGPRWANDQGEVIRVSNNSAATVTELRTLLKSAGTPIAVGFELFASFNNPYSRRTGRITLPLEGDSSIGNHAMLVVGFDDDEGVFLVRNSWGSGWAFANPWHLSGHALIPYLYFTRYSHGSYSMRHMSTVNNVSIPEHLRLYNHRRSSSTRSTALTAAQPGISQPSRKKRSPSKSSRKKTGRKNKNRGRPSLLGRLLGRG
jgi:hypothetical protein